MQASLLKAVGVLSLLVALAACNTTPRLPSASPEEENASIAKLVACLNRNVPQLDDGTSHPMSVALAVVQGPCAAEKAASEEIYTRDMTPAERAVFKTKVNAADQAALDIVIRHRMLADKQPPARRPPAKRAPQVRTQSMQ